ncbi:BTB/POZ domain-containing protein At5g60050-like [Salvia hispanica]|uniref:BTB/POZ domain-containing protein At5g60050 n=1 Tax=Salvia hispanica TaxID=49212 RepID=UPI0020098D0C|nr:BTB/POZ domain-containing protein At5g60050 [Salvia hispanica]XP_047944270.1 BTB/POZ domain-containing protein At5g60050 [Salvia hispanica]XP_047944271.1 BTB/POZ domain-containing protein At5g60050 [Salvia hispanica]XP_047944272.1 BTB/POZ domain-containing protein At5g60050 [Salvia hispanica]XP_047944273.1 BTB/POZ domain-containing protein At5g60050 [Salvia hispanica]XP_047952427.1 BTB/POZ domain-containing protein At5g60050-like [Salvia hispanica]XP_047952428.1 BTB/POZ domain-containing p
MASDSKSNNATTHHKPMSSRLHQQQQLVSTMIKQGFISDPFLSPSRLTPLSPTPHHHHHHSPTLFEIMSADPNPALEARKKLQERVSAALSQAPFNISNQWGPADVTLTVAGRAEPDAPPFRVTLDVHLRVLAAKSRFFSDKLRRSGTHSVEILECDDVAVYVEAVVLMYSAELKTKLLGMEVSKILALLKICCAIMFEDGIRACLEYLEAVPWSEGEEESVVSHLNQLQIDCSRAETVLQRVVADPSTSSRLESVFLKLSLGVLQAKDEKARREMKGFISRLLKEDDKDGLDISRDVLYQLCHRCLGSLVLCLSGTTGLDESRQDRGAIMAEISREAENMQWILGILIERNLGEEFVDLWADQKELALLHSKIPTMYRHEISKITAQLCISIGRGQILVPKETRFALLSTWLEALYDDFGWMRIGGKPVDRKLIEEGLSQTILTLPLPQQQSVLVKWFDRFLNKGDDCPNIQRAFEIWWRRAFVKQYAIESQLQLAVCDIPD